MVAHVLQWVPWQYEQKETHNIFSANINRLWFDIDGRCSENNSASFLREQNQHIANADCAETRNHAEMSLLDDIGLAQKSKQSLKQCAEVRKLKKIDGPQPDWSIWGQLACNKRLLCKLEDMQQKLAFWDLCIQVDSLFWTSFSNFLFPIEFWMVDFSFTSVTFSGGRATYQASHMISPVSSIILMK